MKTTKKIFALLMALIIALSVTTIAFADTNSEETEETSSSVFVANVYLLLSTANPKIPHMWIYVENTSDHALQIGHYTLPAGDSMSMGSWKERGQGEGIHYNMERYWVKDATYDRTIYIKTRCTETQIAMMSSTINRHNYWNWVFNCAWFATCVWNSCTIKFVPFLIGPYIIAPFMFLYGARKLDFTIPKASSKICYKHTDEGLERLYASVLYTNTGV